MQAQMGSVKLKGAGRSQCGYPKPGTDRCGKQSSSIKRKRARQTTREYVETEGKRIRHIHTIEDRKAKRRKNGTGRNRGIGGIEGGVSHILEIKEMLMGMRK